MNIQTRKLNLIEEFLRISDEKLIAKLESLIYGERKVSEGKTIKRMSVKEFHEMIDNAIKDKNNGRVISHDELKKKVKLWKKQ